MEAIQLFETMAEYTEDTPVMLGFEIEIPHLPAEVIDHFYAEQVIIDEDDNTVYIKITALLNVETRLTAGDIVDALAEVADDALVYLTGNEDLSEAYQVEYIAQDAYAVYVMTDLETPKNPEDMVMSRAMAEVIADAEANL